MKKTIIIISIVLLIGISILFLKNKNTGTLGSLSCAGLEISEKTIDGDSMNPLLKDKSKLDLMIDYYNLCGKEVSRGDIIAFNYGGSDVPLIKMVKVLDSDTVSFSGAKMIVNGAIFTNSIGEEYTFDQVQLDMLGMYIKDSKIPKDSFLIFGDNVNNSIDSRKFGAVSQSDFLGKFDFN